MTTQFKEDFDFESANAEFENIRKELFENLKISQDKTEIPAKAAPSKSLFGVSFRNYRSILKRYQFSFFRFHF